MQICELTAIHREDVTALWAEAGLTRPWNDPDADYDRAMLGPTSAVLGTFADGALVGTVMVGYDGHRGWIYYLAVAEATRGRGLGRRLVGEAERWLQARGAVKVNLMVRHSNAGVRAFYADLGYDDVETTVLARWLVDPPSS